jgi:hypothetical protein
MKRMLKIGEGLAPENKEYCYLRMMSTGRLVPEDEECW